MNSTPLRLMLSALLLLAGCSGADDDEPEATSPGAALDPDVVPVTEGDWYRPALDVMLVRLDFAAARGCDGVEPDNMDGFTNDTGFDLTDRDQLAFNRRLANEAHLRGLTVALKNDGDQAGDLVDYFDLSLNEECHAYDECDQLRPFVASGKPVLNAEYADDLSQAHAMKANICPAAQSAGLRTLILPYGLDDAFRIACF